MTIQGAKCHFCPVCDGNGCIGELPGMGGVRDNTNFQLNCSAWDELPAAETDEVPFLRLAPITGAVENVGYPDEMPFYGDLLRAVHKTGSRLSIGDGCPDIKLLSGICAVSSLGAKAAVFIKPYGNLRILERFEWSSPVAEVYGVDIDAYNIVTMRNKVNLEKKTPSLMRGLKRSVRAPFAIKGVFTQEDIELVKEVKPDIVVVSNHGGRVETRTGSSASFLAEHAEALRRNCGQIWVDGGIRKYRDLQVAASYGVSEVLVGRPFISALCGEGEAGVQKLVYETFMGAKNSCLLEALAL